MHRNFKQKQLSQVCRILAGCAVYALGLNLFILPLGLYSGGVVGLAQLLSLALCLCGLAHFWRGKRCFLQERK